jgi:hypothetical protein
MFKYQSIFLLLINFNPVESVYMELENHEEVIKRRKMARCNVFIGLLGAVTYFTFAIINYINALNEDSSRAYSNGIILSSVNLFLEFFILCTITFRKALFSIINVLSWLYSFVLCSLLVIGISLYDKALYENICATSFINENVIGIWTGLYFNFFFTGIGILLAYTKLTPRQIFCLCLLAGLI